MERKSGKLGEKKGEGMRRESKSGTKTERERRKTEEREGGMKGERGGDGSMKKWRKRERQQ